MLSTPAQANSFQGVGDLPGGSFQSQADGVSADGKVVVGASISSNGTEAFRWTAETGMVGLGDLSGGDFSSVANGVSANGSVIVGTGSSRQGTEAFRWTPEGGMAGLGDLPGGDFYSEANAISADGMVVVGTGTDCPGPIWDFCPVPFRWTPVEGMVNLVSQPGFFPIAAGRGISADGTVAVGTVIDYAFRWTRTTGIDFLGILPGGLYRSDAYGASADGAIVVGSSDTATGFNGGVPTRYGLEAFRWTADQGMVGLGALGVLPGAPGALDSQANAVSADGTVIVGKSASKEGQQAFLWDEKNGMRSLRELLITQGLNLTGWWLYEATAISPDGRTVVGTGRNPSGQTEGWIATLEPSSDCSKAKPSANLLWPPNHKFVPISILGVTDSEGNLLSIRIDSIRQDEAVNAEGSGNTAPDGQIDGTGIAQVRAERVGDSGVLSNGRVYHIGFTAEDGKGGSCQGEVLVGVPHDQGQGATPVDDGALYDSTVVPTP